MQHNGLFFCSLPSLRIYDEPGCFAGEGRIGIERARLAEANGDDGLDDVSDGSLPLGCVGGFGLIVRTDIVFIVVVIIVLLHEARALYVWRVLARGHLPVQNAMLLGRALLPGEGRVFSLGARSWAAAMHSGLRLWLRLRSSLKLFSLGHSVMWPRQGSDSGQVNFVSVCQAAEQ